MKVVNRKIQYIARTFSQLNFANMVCRNKFTGKRVLMTACCVLYFCVLYRVCFRDVHFRHCKVSTESSQNIPSRYEIAEVDAANSSQRVTPSEAKQTTTPCFRQIHFWTSRPEILLKHHGEFPCSGLRCGVRIVYGQNYDLLQNSDALLFDYLVKWNWNEFIRRRPAGQKWIFYATESPRHTGTWIIPPPQYNDMSYDYFMTYRTGLEAPLYGAFGLYDDTKPTVEASDTRNWAENKTGMVAWVVSNCNQYYLSWKRTEFVEALSKHISVDIFGACGSQECEEVETCGLHKYKFYLALENSECKDYITATFWRNGLTLGLIPVVYGAKKADYLKVAPPHSFIHVQDFKSIPDLVVYLQKLNENDVLYNEYFEWKKQGSVSYNMQFSHFTPDNMCEIIVRRLLDDEVAAAEGKLEKARMPDWKTWWTDSCHPQGDFPIKLDV